MTQAANTPPELSGTMATIAIDARKYFDFGIGSYIQNLVSALSQISNHHAFIMFASPSDMKRIRPPEGWGLRESAYGKYSVGELMLFGRRARSTNVDLFHEPHYTLPSGLKGASVVTIHDLIHLKMPEFFSTAQRVYARTMIGHALKHAGAIIAVSQQTKQDILDSFRVKEEKVIVIHHGIRPTFRKIDGGRILERFRQTHGLDRRFILYVGNIKPHKNIPRLLSAFARVRERFDDLLLVFAGGGCLDDAKLSEKAAGLGIKGAIRDLHYLDHEELVSAYNTAELVVLPSLYEGFGFPALEAMACGTPAIVSTAGSLREIAGEAALVVDPLQPEAIEGAIELLLSDSSRRADLVAKGFAHVKQFSWQKTAEQTLETYEKVLDECRRN